MYLTSSVFIFRKSPVTCTCAFISCRVPCWDSSFPWTETIQHGVSAYRCIDGALCKVHHSTHNHYPSEFLCSFPQRFHWAHQFASLYNQNLFSSPENLNTITTWDGLLLKTRHDYNFLVTSVQQNLTNKQNSYFSKGIVIQVHVKLHFTL